MTLRSRCMDAYRYSARQLFFAVGNAPLARSVYQEDELVQRKSINGGSERERTTEEHAILLELDRHTS